MAHGRKGRRPGSPDTRGQILSAARREFAAHGYGGATIRGIATGAGVDPALVLHYHGSKERLFVATLDVPVNPADVVRGILDRAAPGPFGRQLVATMLTTWDDTANRSPLIAVLRSATGGGPIADTVRQFIEGSIVTAFADALHGPEPQLRAVLIGSQIAGLLMGRYVLGLEPLASAGVDRLAAIYGPTIDRYAYDDLPPRST